MSRWIEALPQLVDWWKTILDVGSDSPELAIECYFSEIGSNEKFETFLQVLTSQGLCTSSHAQDIMRWIKDADEDTTRSISHVRVVFVDGLPRFAFAHLESRYRISLSRELYTDLSDRQFSLRPPRHPRSYRGRLPLGRANWGASSTQSNGWE